MSEIAETEHERLRDDLAAYALGALRSTEAEGLERHLEDCEDCRERLRWLKPAVDVLPATAEQLSPPASLRENLMRAVRAEAAEAEPGASRSARTRPEWRGALRLALRPASVFAVVLLVAGVAIGYAVRGTDTPSGSFIEAQTSSGLARDVSATLEKRGDSAILHVHELPKIDRDEVYEVWVKRGNAVEPASLFALHRDGSAEAAVPGPLEGADAVLVTREPQGGSAQPTNPPLLKASLE